MPSATMALPQHPDLLAPDGSQVRILLSLTNASMAHFTLPPGETSRAVRHRTVEEIWFILSGTGEMWRSDSAVTPLTPALCLTIPCGVSFQFRTIGDLPLTAVAVTTPPWPGENEAEFVAGPWPPTPAQPTRPPNPHRSPDSARS